MTAAECRRWEALQADRQSLDVAAGGCACGRGSRSTRASRTRTGLSPVGRCGRSERGARSVLPRFRGAVDEVGSEVLSDASRTVYVGAVDKSNQLLTSYDPSLATIIDLVGVENSSLVGSGLHLTKDLSHRAGRHSDRMCALAG